MVIADDLTGAAEIGGIVLRHGLSVEIVHTLETPLRKDVRILNTNTRSLKEDEALSHLKDLFSANSTPQWDWIYLKFDSALRGHIATEISFYREIFKKEKIVFCPVNPSLGRVIVDGLYWVDGKPIAETDFARDPEFPIVRSDILEVLGGDHWHLVDDLQGLSVEKSSFIVAAASDIESLHKWASTTTLFSIYAGAAAFFEALLLQRRNVLPVRKASEPKLQTPVLYVCGSNHENSIKRINEVNADKVVYWQSIGKERDVAREVLHKLEESGKVILAIAPTVSHEARMIRACLAEVVGIVQQTCVLQELVIEGGATARAVLEVLEIDTLVPVWEYGQGVIRNRVPGVTLTVTLKPGSYLWAEKLWAF